MDTQTTTTIDRTGEYDQTHRHVHDAGPACCDGGGAAGRLSRRLAACGPPSEDDVLELKLNRPAGPKRHSASSKHTLFHELWNACSRLPLAEYDKSRWNEFQQLITKDDAAMRRLETENHELRRVNGVLRRRIEGFEAMARSLSEFIDRSDMMLKNGVRIDAADIVKLKEVA